MAKEHDDDHAQQSGTAEERETQAPTAQTVHIPVMPDETLAALQPHAGGRYLDGTLGGAGHTQLLLDASAPGGRVLAIDADPLALERARALLPEAIAGERLLLAHGNFAHMGELATAANFAPVDGILLDLGLSPTSLPTASAVSLHARCPARYALRYDARRLGG